MNKTKRNIINLRIKLVRKLITHVEPFPLDMKWLNKWYTANAVTPLQMVSIVRNLRDSKLHAIYFGVNDSYNNNYNIWGNFFVVKFPMCAYVSGKKNVKLLSRSYTSWCKDNDQLYKDIRDNKH